MRELLHKDFGISLEIIGIFNTVMNAIKPRLEAFQEVAGVNQLRVLSAFRSHRISDTHFIPTTGYGYHDEGREAIDAVYAQIFDTEDALVRHTIINGTHAIALCLYAALRPGDTLVSVTGKPYDTLEEVIGIRGAANGSLKNLGVCYRQLDLKNGRVDYNNIMSTLTPDVKAVLIQKSKGYDWRPSLSNEEIGRIVQAVKSVRADIICIVDNCYGEFVQTKEPTAYGADLAAGSLIKNPGGGLVATGGYVAGRKDLVEAAAYRLNAPGLGKHVGPTLGMNREILQGLFMAPQVVAQSLSASLLCAGMLEHFGFDVTPRTGETRYDIIQAIRLGSSEAVIKFCQGIQKGAPIDSFVTPVPWDMPGYDAPVIMAAGAFTQGSSIELSADAPIKPPYIAYMQGGLTLHSAAVGILSAVQGLADEGLIKL